MATTKKEEVMETSEELFDYYAPKSKENQADIPVWVNGKCTLIQRGQHVKVNAAVYEILMNKERMEALALERSEELQQNQ